MKKGTGLKITGIILIVLQIVSLTGNAKMGVKLYQIASLYDIVFLLSYFLVGIIGLILFVWGCIIATRRENQTDTIIKEIELTEEEKEKEKQKQNKNDLIKYALIATIIVLLAIIILLLIVLNTKDINSNHENMSSIPTQSQQTSTSSSILESSSEAPTSSQNIVINKNDLDNWGDFSSIHKLRTHCSRNLENPKYVLVSVEGLVVRNAMNQVYIIDEPESQGVRWRRAIKNQVASDLLDEANDFMVVSMKDDTKNRVITGDYIKLSGVLDTENLTIIDAEYKMIKAFE